MSYSIIFLNIFCKFVNCGFGLLELLGNNTCVLSMFTRVNWYHTFE